MIIGLGLTRLVATVYGIAVLRPDVGRNRWTRAPVGELRLLSQQIVAAARQANEVAKPSPASGKRLRFDEQMDATRNPVRLADQLSFIRVTAA